MRNARTALAAALALTLFATLSSGPARAVATGVGTSSAETTVVGVDLGTDGALLAVRLLGDNARSTIDPKVASAAEAFSRITGLSVNSSVDALDKSSGVLESKDPGGEKQVTQGSVNLSNPTAGVTVPDEVVTGTIGLTSLSSSATAAKSSSTIAASLTNATIGGALASVQGVSSTLSSVASDTSSETSRSVKVDQVVVLDLGSFLEGLGLSVLDLPVATVTDLLDTLNLDVGNLANDAVQGAIDDLQAEITSLTALLSLPTPALPTGTTVDGVIDVINGIGVVTVPTTTETTITAQTGVTQINSLIDQLQDALAALLTQVALEVDTAPLLSATALEAAVTTKAADTVGNSSAKTTAGLGSITVGSITIPGVDLLDAKADIDKAVADTLAPLNSALGSIATDLQNMVTVKLLEPATSTPLSTANGYVKATEGVTVLRVGITPPSTLTTVVDGILAQAGLDAAITAAGGTAPTLAPTMDELKTALGTSKSLGGGGGVRIAQVLGTSEFAAAGAGTGGPGGGGSGTPGEDDRQLPETGQNTTLPLTAFATLLVALGLGFRQWLHMPVPARIRTRTR